MLENVLTDILTNPLGAVFSGGFNPSSYGNVMWDNNPADLSTITKDGSDFVSYQDLGNGLVADQINASLQPKWEISAVSGLPSISSPVGNNYRLDLADNAKLSFTTTSLYCLITITGGSGAFSYAVWKWAGGGNYEYIMSASVGATTKPRLSVSPNGSAIGTVDAASAIVNGSTHLLEMHCDGAESEFFIDGVSQGVSSNSIFDSGADLNFFNGSDVGQEIHRAIQYQQMQTAAQIAATRAALMAMGGIA